MEEAIDNIANNVRPLESAQTIMHNVALLAVSDHPQAIIDGLTAYAEPLFEGDFDNMKAAGGFPFGLASLHGFRAIWEHALAVRGGSRADSLSVADFAAHIASADFAYPWEDPCRFREAAWTRPVAAAKAVTAVALFTGF